MKVGFWGSLQMANEELERRLLDIIKEQQESKVEFSSKCRRLLDAFRGTTPPSDVFYVLTQGTDGQEMVDDAFDNPNTVYFEPQCFDYEGERLQPHPGNSLDKAVSVVRGEINPGDMALVVDDCWDKGTTARKTVAYLEHLGYERDRIFIFHYLGSCAITGPESEKFGFTRYNPVLVSAATMLDFFDYPEKYQ